MKVVFFPSVKVLLAAFIIVCMKACVTPVDRATGLDKATSPLSIDLKAQSESVIEDIGYATLDIDVGTGLAARQVNLSISYPKGEGSYPLIVFSHGNGLDNESYRNLSNYWVERGYVVIAPLHLDTGGDFSAMSAINDKYGRDWISASRVIEMGAVIDQVDKIASDINGFKGRILSNKVIAAGHSFGALSSQQLSGAHIEKRGDSLYPIPENLIHEKVVAVVAVSPPGLIKGSLSKAAWQGFKTPQLVVTGTNDFFPGFWPNYQDHFVSYLTAEEGDNFLLTLDGMDHYLGNLIGRLDRDSKPQVLANKNIQEISLLFMQHYLRDKDTRENGPEFAQRVNSKQRDGVLAFKHR